MFESTDGANQKIEYLNMNLNVDFFNSLSFDNINQYRYDAAKYCSETLGDKPALCMSGGADSQAMVQCFYEAGYNFDVYTLSFKNSLNMHDVISARRYCAEKGIRLYELDFDILGFLTRENYDYAHKYQCSSPHFNTHFKMFDILKSMGYTSVVCGGNVPTQNTESDGHTAWGAGYNRNVMSFIKYSKISGFLAQGNFLSYYPKLAWATAILTPRTECPRSTYHTPWEQELRNSKMRYDDKVLGYQRAGFDILPQDTKYTGFELVKKYYEDRTGDGWYFEKMFRHPLEKSINRFNYGHPELYLSVDLRSKIDSLYNQHIVSSVLSGV